MIARHCVLRNCDRLLGQGSKGINFSGWHGLDMSITVTKRRWTLTNQTLGSIIMVPIFFVRLYGLLDHVPWIGLLYPNSFNNISESLGLAWSRYVHYCDEEMLNFNISESAVPNNGKVGNPVLCPHSRCFGSYFDVIFLAPPAEWQRSFSNTDSSVVRRRRRLSTFHLNGWFLKNGLITFFLFLAWSFLRKVLMYCQNMNLVESS